MRTSIFPLQGVTQESLTKQLELGAGVKMTSAAFDLVGGTTVLVGTTSSANGGAVITHRRAICLTAEDVTIVAAVSLGTNAPDYNNILASWTLTNLDDVGRFIQTTIASGEIIAPGSGIYAKLIAPATATAQTAEIILELDYQPS